MHKYLPFLCWNHQFWFNFNTYEIILQGKNGGARKYFWGKCHPWCHPGLRITKSCTKQLVLFLPQAIWFDSCCKHIGAEQWCNRWGTECPQRLLTGKFLLTYREKRGKGKWSRKDRKLKKGKGDTAAVSGSWKLPLPAPATTVAKNQCLTCCLTCCFWCWISHWVLLILSWNMWLRGRSGGLWLGRDPGGVGGSVKIGDWVFDLVGVFPWLRSFGLTFRLLVLREYSYLGVYLSAVTIWSMPFVLVSCC